MLLFIPRSLCALKRITAKSEHARFGATQGIRPGTRALQGRSDRRPACHDRAGPDPYRGPAVPGEELDSDMPVVGQGAPSSR